MGAALALLVTLAAFVFVAWPLVRRSRLAGMDGESDLLMERDLAIEDLRELDFDHDLGNLSEEDHQRLREQSKRRAVAVLRRLQAQESHIDEEIEQAVAALRRK